MLSVKPSKQGPYNCEELCSLVIEKEWQIARARHHVKIISTDLGFNEVHTAQIITSLSELGYNLIFHSTKGGIVYVSSLHSLHAVGIKITCIDYGPGISSINDALLDGFSTNGGLGGGLPGVERLMDEFCIRSNKDGTHIDCIKWNK